MKSIQARVFDELSLRYMVGFQRQNRSGHSSFLLSMLQTSAYAAMHTAGAMPMYVHPIAFAAWTLTLFLVFTSLKLFRKNVHSSSSVVLAFFRIYSISFRFLGPIWEECFTRQEIPTIAARVACTPVSLLFGYVDAFGMLLFAAKILSSLTPETKHRFF